MKHPQNIIRLSSSSLFAGVCVGGAAPSGGEGESGKVIAPPQPKR